MDKKIFDKIQSKLKAVETVFRKFYKILKESLILFIF